MSFWQIWLYLLLVLVDLGLLVKMLLSQWRKEFWLGTSSWRKAEKLHHSTGYFFAMYGNLPPHIQWILVFQKQENYNSEVNYHTVLISKSSWATGDPKWPWKLQVNLENSMFCSQSRWTSMKHDGCKLSGQFQWWNWLWEACGKWQHKSKDLLNAKFALRWVFIITATSVSCRPWVLQECYLK